MMRIVLLLIVLIGTGTTRAQSVTGEAALPPVSEDGFYRVHLIPVLTRYLTPQFSNIRLYDAAGKEVPFLFQEEPAQYYSHTFKKYNILEKKSVRNCCTTILLRNEEKQAISNISLQIKNAEVVKTATLLGSDDRVNWFVIRQRFDLHTIDGKNNTSEIRIVDFPLSNYEYFSIHINDSTSAPLNILSAGYYEDSSTSGRYTVVPTAKVEKSDTANLKRTYVQIAFDTVQLIDRLELRMKGAPYFQRRATLYSEDVHVVKRGRRKIAEKYLYPLLDFQIRSSQPAVISLDALHSKKILVVMENDDNPVLELTSATVYQRNRYLTAWLERDKQYKLKIGDANSKTPVYDLAFFQDSIPAHPNVILPKEVKETLAATTPVPPDSFFKNKSIIWIAIGAVILVLGVLSVRLVRETAKRQS